MSKEIVEQVDRVKEGIDFTVNCIFDYIYVSEGEAVDKAKKRLFELLYSQHQESQTLKDELVEEAGKCATAQGKLQVATSGLEEALVWAKRYAPCKVETRNVLEQTLNQLKENE